MLRGDGKKMAEYTVASLIRALEDGYEPDEIIVATWYTKADIAQVVEDEEWDVHVDVDDVWANVSRNVDLALDYAESDLNDEIIGFVSDYVQKGGN